jgi:hypothetical protein
MIVAIVFKNQKLTEMIPTGTIVTDHWVIDNCFEDALEAHSYVAGRSEPLRYKVEHHHLNRKGEHPDAQDGERNCSTDAAIRAVAGN